MLYISIAINIIFAIMFIFLLLLVLHYKMGFENSLRQIELQKQTLEYLNNKKGSL